MKIDWNKVWKDYAKWRIDTFFLASTKEGDQWKKIQSLVEAQLRRKHDKRPGR